MASAGFQLFPPPPPRMNQSPISPIARGGSKRRNGKSPSNSPVSPIQEVEKFGYKSGAVVIQIIEPSRTNTPVQVPPAAIVIDAGNPVEPSSEERAEVPYADNPERSRAISPATQRTNSPTLFRSNSAASPEPHESPVRMRSMFPTYNPRVPLSKQKYYPPRGASPQNLPSQVLQRGEYSPNATSPSPLDNALGGPKTAPASVIDFPLDALDPTPTSFSSSEDLERLWLVANGQDDGQGSQLTLGMSFNLEMSRSEAANFSFSAADTFLPFYSLQTFSNNDITITRHHPQKPSLKYPVMMSTLESQTRRRTPYDGLVTLLFPKLAAMLAIDEATELTRQNRLSPDIAEQVAADAVKRAADLEGCRLTYDDNHNRYELAIPCLKTPNQTAQSPNQRSIQTAATHPGVLHITVSQPPDSSSASVIGQATPTDPVIIVTNPYPVPQQDTQTHDPATSRTSTLPIAFEDGEAEAPLASLDFGTGALSISTSHITSMIPSLYAIDTIVSAMFAIAVADESTNRVMAALPIGVRPERKQQHKRVPSLSSRLPSLSGIPKRAQTAGSVVSVNTIGTSHTHIQPKILVATLAERADHDLDDNEDEATLMSKLSKSKSKSSKKATKMHPSSASTKSKSKDKSKLKTKKIMVAEIDLEKYAEGGDELPRVTRGVLKGMFLTLQFVCWILTCFVEMMAWILVKTTRFVTSENF